MCQEESHQKHKVIDYDLDHDYDCEQKDRKLQLDANVNKAIQ